MLSNVNSGNMQVNSEFQRHRLVHFEEAYKYLVLTILNLRA